MSEIRVQGYGAAVAGSEFIEEHRITTSQWGDFAYEIYLPGEVTPYEGSDATASLGQFYIGSMPGLGAGGFPSVTLDLRDPPPGGWPQGDYKVNVLRAGGYAWSGECVAWYITMRARPGFCPTCVGLPAGGSQGIGGTGSEGGDGGGSGMPPPPTGGFGGDGGPDWATLSRYVRRGPRPEIEALFGRRRRR